MTQARGVLLGFWRRMALLAAGGSAFILGSCDPTLRATTENGIISVSTAALASFMTAVVELWQEAN